MPKIEHIPTHLIVGFLGVGKTTAIQSLLEHRPEGEKWLIVVNEFGEIGVDEALVDAPEDGELFIKEIPGGCICCSAKVTLQQTLVQALRRTRPDRVVIEPTGLGHPAGIIDLLTKEFKDVLDLRAVIGLVDPGRIGEEKVRLHPVFTDQVVLADILVANKCDLCDEQVLRQFDEWAADLFPAKQIVAHTTYGQLDPKWLQEEQKVVRKPQFPQLHAPQSTSTSLVQQKSYNIPKLGEMRYDSFRAGTLAKGWLFHADNVFEIHKLKAVLDAIEADRVKGIFHTTEGWVAYNRSGNEIVALFPTAYRKDSRIEVITTGGELDENRIEGWLKSAMMEAVQP